MKVAVTAAGGNLGGAIIKALAVQIGEENVVGLARTPSKATHLAVEVRAGDYDDKRQLEKSLEGIEAVLLLSGMDAPDKRINQHRNVIQAAISAGSKKIVYTSVQGAEEGNAFSPIIQSNRQTEQDVRNCGLEWVIGRNGIYIEPDVDYLENYKKAGEIANCAADGKCGYTTRPELAYAYGQMLTNEKHNGNTYNLHGKAITQKQLANYFNQVFGTQIKYREMEVDAYREERVEELGEFLGSVIAGIYQGIREGKIDNPSHFAKAAGREHQNWEDYFRSLTK